jgi:type IV pilus assembly protein PilQ
MIMRHFDFKIVFFLFLVLGLMMLGMGLILGRAEPLSGGPALSGGTISVTKEPGIAREPVFSMEFRDADLKDVLRAIGQQNNLNMIVGEDVQGKLTLSFQKVTLNEALEAIFRNYNLTSIQEGNILRVVKSPFLEGEEDLVTKMIPLNYTKAKDTALTMKGLLSRKGSLAVDERTNTLLIRDVPDNVDKILKIVKNLDSKTPQVLIEARIVEASTNFTRELGIQWGGNLTAGTSRFTGGVAQTTSIGPGNPLTGGVGLSGNNFIVNFPATLEQGFGSALGFTIGNVAGTKQLDIQLSAMEDSGKGRILSNPKILTLDNKEAKISSGFEILIPVTAILGIGTTATSGATTGSTSTTGVTTIEAKLDLTVTPHVTSDNQIVMHVKTDKKEPDFNREVQNIPPLTTRTAETDLLVRDGQTVVIGGIYTRNESADNLGVPWLSKIPILGWLFKKESKTDTQSELLIFITPTIYKM